MLQTNRKSESSPGARSASPRPRAYAHTALNPQADTANTRKAAVLAQGTRRGTAPHAQRPKDFQAKIPVIAGEFHYRGIIAVDGLVSGQFGASSGCLSLKQKSNPSFGSGPELEGELTFRDMVRVNGHIAGSVSSGNGTLIVDVGARVDANIDVAVAVISGTVNGDILAHDRVEIGPVAIIRGKISTRSIIIRDGAIFEGVCSMLDQD